MIAKMLACGAILLAVAPAHAGWRGAEWGMTPQQVAEAMQGEAPLTRAGTTGNASGVNRPGNKGEFNWDGEKFAVSYIYDQDGLRSIKLEPKKAVTQKRCANIVDKVVAQHGQPIRVLDQLILMNIFWHDKPSDNRLMLLVSVKAGICSLSISRLGDHEAYDLENPGVEVRPPQRS